MVVRFVAPRADAITAAPLTGEDWLRAGLILVATLVVAIAASRIARRALTRWLRTGFGALQTRHPFTLGDTVRVGDQVGTVADIAPGPPCCTGWTARSCASPTQLSSPRSSSTSTPPATR
ncbi:MAG: hypothetical protein KDB06_08235 [Ilumatobacter sp.]|nr:hypothetical protein [Ilumatobacter sp.]MCB0984627.1 hypothetical protein [Ilumatobacter sp.]